MARSKSGESAMNIKFCICKEFFSTDTQKADGKIFHAVCKLPFRCEICESDNPKPAVTITPDLVACGEHRGRGDGSLLIRHR